MVRFTVLGFLGSFLAICYGCGAARNVGDGALGFRIVALTASSGAGRLLEFDVSEENPVASGRPITSIPWLVGGIESGFRRIVIGSRDGHEPRILVVTERKTYEFELDEGHRFAGTSISIFSNGWLAADNAGISVFSFSGGLRTRLERGLGAGVPRLEVTEDRAVWFIDRGHNLVALDFRSDVVLATKPIPAPITKGMSSGALLGSCGETVYVSRLGRCRLQAKSEGEMIHCEGLSGWGKRIQHVACCAGKAMASRTVEFPRIYTEFGLLDSGPTTRLDGVTVFDFACVETGGAGARLKQVGK